MSRPLTSSKKSKKFLSIVYENKEGKKQQAFLRSYSQLINSHFNISKNQKYRLRKTSSSSQGFRTKSSKKLKNQQFDSIKGEQNNEEKLDRNLSCSFQLNPSHDLMKQSHKKILLNPQSQQKIQKIIISKFQQVQMDSYNNVALNSKLQQSNRQKIHLSAQIQNLKKEIADQKGKKMKISLQLGKLMNKNEQTYNNLMKVKRQREQINVQSQAIQNFNEKKEKKNQKLQSIVQGNNQKIRIQQQLIESIQNNILKNKIALSQTKTHLNQIKAIYTYECKVLTKVRMNKQGFSDQRDKLCNVVHSSVYDTKPMPNR